MVNLADCETSTRYEDELLVCCARVSLGPEVSARMEQLLRGPLDWQTVLKRAWWHRIRPLTYRHLLAQSPGQVPEPVLEELAKYSEELEHRNQYLESELCKVATLFEDSAIRMLVFKGPTLTRDAYGDLRLRECGDLDLLVHRDDLPQAMEMLESNGFQSAWNQVDEKRPRQVFACEFRREGVELDLHWDLAPGWHNFHVDFDRLWDGGLPLAADSRFVRKLSAEDSIVVLCMHGTKHWWERLRWICDIAELVNSGGVQEWDRVEAAAVEARSRRPVLLGLCLAGDLLAAELPEEVRQTLDRTPVVSRLAAQVGIWLRHGESGSESRRLRERFLFRMRLSERMRDRVPQIAHYLLASPAKDDD